MKIKEQTRKLAVGCSKYIFEVVDRTDEVSNHTHGKATWTWFEEIFEEYKSLHNKTHTTKVSRPDNMRFSVFIQRVLRAFFYTNRRKGVKMIFK